MNENYLNSYNEEMEINLVDLMFYLLKQWKSLIVFLVIGALLGTGVYFIKAPSANEAEVNEILSVNEAEEAAEKLEISADTLMNMELAYRYRTLYEEQVRYNQNSILMQIDTNNTYTGVLKYYLSAGDNTKLIGLLYQNLASEQDFLDEIQEKASLSCEEQYVRELVSCSLTNNDNLVININDSDTDVVPESGFQSMLVVYNFIYSDGDTCEQMLEVAREKIEELRIETQEKYGEYVLEPVFDGVQIGVNNDRLDSQKSNVDVLNTCVTNSTKLESAFTEEEMAYYETVYLGRKDVEASSDTEMEEISEVSQSSKGSAAKWLLIGVFLGIVCWGGYFLVRYLFDRRIKYAEELPDYYRVHLIGRYQDADKRVTGIDSLRANAVNKKLGECSSKEYIASALNLLDVKSLFLTGNMNDAETKEFSQDIQKLCAKVEYGNLMQNDSTSIEKAKEKEGIVLLVKKGQSTHMEVQRELEICRLQKLHVCGAVVIE